jgi:hypothetical protein
MIDVLLARVWAPPLLWALLYISDYALSIAAARLYQSQNKMVFEGSYEITPTYQADVNALRRISPRFLFLLTLTTAYVSLLSVLMRPWAGASWWYLFLLGSMVLLEATVHVRHLRNWYLFKRIVPQMQGRMTYPRGIMLSASAFELLVFSLLYTIIWAVTEHPFLLGGALSCAATSIAHYRVAWRHDSQRSQAAGQA